MSEQKIVLRERKTASFGGRTCLRVYPHLAPDAADLWMVSAGYVEALRYYDVDGQPAEGVSLNVTYFEPQTREDTDRLKAALDRCWEWLEATRDEQGKQ